MKKLLYVVLTVVAFLGLSTAAEAQGMYPHYSLVHNWSVTVDSNNNWIFSAQLITEGYATVGCQTCIPSNARHQAHATQSWDSGSPFTTVNGGSVWGPQLCVTCNLYAESDGTATAYDVIIDPPPTIDWIVFEDDPGGEVLCTVAGILYHEGEFLDYEIAYTRDINTGVNRGTVSCFQTDTCNVWNTNEYCTADTAPPDWNPNAYVVSTSYLGQPQSVWYIDGATACIRIHGTGINGWVCLSDQSGTFFPGSATKAWPQNPALQATHCSHHP